MHGPWTRGIWSILWHWLSPVCLRQKGCHDGSGSRSSASCKSGHCESVIDVGVHSPIQCKCFQNETRTEKVLIVNVRLPSALLADWIERCLTQCLGHVWSRMAAHFQSLSFPSYSSQWLGFGMKVSASRICEGPFGLHPLRGRIFLLGEPVGKLPVNVISLFRGVWSHLRVVKWRMEISTRCLFSVFG